MNCTPLVFFTVQFLELPNYSGNLSVELDSVMYCNVRQEHSYLVSPKLSLLDFLTTNALVPQVDCSKELLTWAKAEGYAVLDVNVFPKPFPKSKVRASPTLSETHHNNARHP